MEKRIHENSILVEKKVVEKMRGKFKCDMGARMK